MSAFQSLYEGLRKGRFPRLEDRDDLWRLLVHLTACKAIDRHRAMNRQKRGGGKVVNEVDMIAAGTADDDRATRSTGSSAQSRARSLPQWWLRSIPAARRARKPTLRRIAELKLACYSNEEIRQQLDCSSQRHAEARADPQEVGVDKSFQPQMSSRPIKTPNSIGHPADDRISIRVSD